MATANPGGIIGRIKAILLQPKAEWAVIDTEPASTGSIMTTWVVPLAAIGPVAALIGAMVFGYSFFGVTYRPPIVSAVTTAVVSYVLALVGVYVFALVINALAPSFGGQQNQVQALKVAAYGSTAGFLAGIFGIVPGLGILGILGLYNLYLIYTGLPVLMKAPQEKAVGYVVVAIIVMIVIYVVVGAVAATTTGAFMPRPAPGTISIG